MFIDNSREKLINAILYFVENTRHCHTLKLFKLLNFLDFEHYRQTGRSVTGLDYRAWEMGPAPTALWHELKNPGADLRAAVSILPVKDDLTSELLRREIKPKREFDQRYFTRRELTIMDRLAEFFRDSKANDMSEFSHWRKLPWFRVFGKGEGRGRDIPYDLALTSEPIIQDAATIDNDELAYRRDAMKEVRKHRGR